jgi:hypothetical protein
MTYEVGSVAPRTDQLEEPTKTFIEGVVPYTNTPLIDPLGPLLVELFSKIFLYAYSSYHLPASSATRESFCMNPLRFESTEGLGVSPPLSKTQVVDPAREKTAIVGASYLLGTYVTQVTLTQPLANITLFSHGLGNIPSSLVRHMHTPSALLGHSISQMATNQVIHTISITQATHPTYPTLQTGSSYIPFIVGQSSMGGQPLARGKHSIGGKPLTGEKPSAGGKHFTGEKTSSMGKNPMWGQL